MPQHAAHTTHLLTALSLISGMAPHTESKLKAMSKTHDNQEAKQRWETCTLTSLPAMSITAVDLAEFV